MKKALSALVCLVMLVCMNPAVFAAELLDVKPVVAENAVSVEITADIAMTYTYYKVPGQARAVVDIAEADPEKVEPLIVVNKGAVSSISVDKAQISGIVVSRLIFNLVSEADIAVSASPDRKKLTVTFGSSAAAVKTEPKPEVKAVPVPEPAAKIEPPAPAPAASQTAAKTDDPLGLDEPATAAAAPVAKAVAAVVEAPAAVAAAPVVTRIPKLEPVVPVMAAPSAVAAPSALSIKEIATGATYIEIRANKAIADYKAAVITKPERLVIDIPGNKIQQKAKSVTINKFGVSKARIGVSPKNIRIVIDSAKAGFPAYTITNTEDGLRINFK